MHACTMGREDDDNEEEEEEPVRVRTSRVFVRPIVALQNGFA